MGFILTSFKMITNPKRIVDQLKSCKEITLIILGILLGINTVIFRRGIYYEFNNNINIILLFSGCILGIIYTYILSYCIHWLSKKFGSIAEWKSTRVILICGTTPLLIRYFILAVRFLVFGSKTIDIINLEPKYALLFAIIYIVDIVTSFISFIFILLSLQEIHGLSVNKIIISILSSGLISGLIIMLLFGKIVGFIDILSIFSNN